jgi:cell filamentation protein
VSFDPFGDFATEGYLRNVEKEKDLDIVKDSSTLHSRQG